MRIKRAIVPAPTGKRFLAMVETSKHDVIVIGGGLAGLSAAVYLGRALRDTLVVDDDQSLAIWEPNVENYLGFPEGIDGRDLLRRGRHQAEQFGVHFAKDRICSAGRVGSRFQLAGNGACYECDRLLLATGLYHLPPEIPEVEACLGQSMFFCKDCDAHRVQGKRIAIVGSNDEAVEYALGMLLYSSCVIIASNGRAPTWDAEHAAWIKEYQLPVFPDRIIRVEHSCGKVGSLTFADERHIAVDSIFTTRGDIFHNTLAQNLGAELDPDGQIVVDNCCRTSVPGLYAAGCVTPANCQMIIAAGQGATAAQAINRSLFEESLLNHSLRRFRNTQLRTEQTLPEPVL